MEIDRNEVISRLRPSVADQLATVERATGLQVSFVRKPTSSHVEASYTFDPNNNSATIGLITNWQDVDVAHELLHMQIELVEGFKVLAWRCDATRSAAILAAIGQTRTLPDDQIVNSRLVAAGFELNGEVLKWQFFDDRCTIIPRNLRAAKSLKNDGMAHLDGFGYGDFYRATLFAQVQFARDAFSDCLSDQRVILLDDFLDTFARYRPRQLRKAKRILRLFQENDVQTIHGHEQILAQLARMENLDQFMGISSYCRQTGRYILPWP